MQKKHLYHLPKRVVCMTLAAMMALSTALTGCGSQAITTHALEDEHDHVSVETVSDETVSLRETLVENLDDSLAKQATDISDDYWENDVPADEQAVGAEFLNNEGLLPSTMAASSDADSAVYDTGSSVDIDSVDTPLTEESYDENGVRETEFGIEVMYTVVERDYLDAYTVTEMWNSNSEAFVTNARVEQPLYEVEGYPDVYVAFINYSGLNDTEGEIISADFSRNTIYNPVDMSDDVVFDKETGVLYIPKAYGFAGDGTEVGVDLKAQVMVAIDSFADSMTDEDGNLLANVSVTVENNSGADTILQDGKYSMTAYDYAVLPLFAPGSVEDLMSDDISVYVNEGAEPVAADDLLFNPETGNLTVNSFAVSVTNIKVVFNDKPMLQAMANFFSVGKASAADKSVSLTPLSDRNFTDGMVPIFNVTTGEELNPNIDITNVHVGDVFAYETNDKELNNNTEATEAMKALGQNDFVYTTDFAKMDRTTSYKTLVGENAELDLSKMEYGLGYDSAWSFIIELPGDSPTKKQHSPMKIKGDGVGQIVYFGTVEDWQWINPDDPRLASYPGLNENHLHMVYGQCSHTANDAYLPPDFNSDGDITKPFFSCSCDAREAFKEINNGKFECEGCNCEECIKYRNGREKCDKWCPHCSEGKCPGCTAEYGCAFFRWKNNRQTCNEDCYSCKTLMCGKCSGTAWIGDATGGHFHAGAVARVLAVGEGYMVLGLAQTDNGASQRGSSVIKVRTSVKIQVKKETTSTLNDGVNNNDCYEPLAASEYTVYRDADLTDAVGTIKGDGEDYVLVTIGDYWIKETRAPIGYYMDIETHPVHPTEDTCYTFSDDPMDDPIIIAAQKNVQNRDTAGVTTGDVGPLSGIQFDVSYYKNEYDSLESLPAVADEHAVFQTDEMGLLAIDDDHIMPGQTWKYRGTSGKMLFPMGTILVKEKSSIDGLLIYNTAGMLFTLTDTSDKTSNRIRPITWTDEDGNTVPGYHGTITTLLGSSNKELTTDRAPGSYENQPARGGVTVWKADLDWEKSDFQGDATLAGAEFTIYNRSETSVWYKGNIYAVDEAIDTIVTAYDEVAGGYVATTGTYSLEYGTYEIVETKAPEGYNMSEWSNTFTIREDGQMHYYNRTNEEDIVNGLNWIHRWCVDPVMRGGVAFGKVDRETKQYFSLGASSLAGATFELYNRSIHPVYVDGVTYAVDEMIMDFVAEEMDIVMETGIEGYTKTIIGNTTGNYVLPYGTYEIIETGTGIGYLFDSNSKAQSKVFSIRGEGDMHYFTDEVDAFHNKVQREDWYFSKKADDSGHEMPNVAWTITSVTTGETHIIVTDENGQYKSDQVPHTQRTNSNDPDSPISNGAVAINEDGDYYVADASKLDYDAGTWFTGVNPEYITWNEDGLSYNVNLGVKDIYGNVYESTGIVDDTLRAYPYDTYLVQELPSEANEGYNLVNFIVTLKRYNDDPDSNGIILDYGTVDDQHVDIFTHLGYTPTKFSNIVKFIPSAEEVEVIDVITYSGLTAGGEYTMKGEIHATDDEGNDLGVVATNEMTFTAKASGQLKMPFTLNTSEDDLGAIYVATEAIYQDGTLLTEENDLTNIDQSVTIGDAADPVVPDKKVVEIDTYAVNGKNYTKELSAATEQSIYECIKLANMKEDVSYKLEGAIYWIDEDGNARAILDSEGNPIAAVIENPNTAEVMIFKGIDASELGGKDIVVHQTVYERKNDEDEWKVSSEHCDNEDADQTVHVPAISGTPTGDPSDYPEFDDMPDGGTILTAENGIHNAEAGTVTLTDKVAYVNVTPGQKYVVKGTLHFREDTETEDGYVGVDMGEVEGVTGSAEFIAEDRNGIVDVVFTLDASELEGKVVVAFEELYTDAAYTVPDDWADFFGTGEIAALADEADTDEADEVETVTGDLKLLAEHKDISDAAQSVGFADIKATTLTTDGESHVAFADGEVTFTDAVEYEGLIPGTEYNIDGSLFVKGDEDSEAIATVENTFTPVTPNGTIDVTFTFDPAGLDGKTVVAFETISFGETELASHKDMEDAAQSVQFIGLDTVLTGTRAEFKLSDTDETTGEESKDLYFEVYSGYVENMGESNYQVAAVEFKDSVTYSNLTPGKEYTLKGELHMRSGVGADLGAVSDTKEITFIPEAESGTVDVVFTHAPAGIENAKLVMFEYLYDGDKLIASHADITDEDQTVTVTANRLEPEEDPKNPKNPCGCNDPDCKHKDEKDHCVNNPGCCDDSDCCKDCSTCKKKNPCGCDDPDCKHKDEKDHCVNNPGCCDDSDCCKDCDDCKKKNPCGCDDPNCKHKNEKDHCKNNPGCCDDSDCCKDCDDCKEKNPCGCTDPKCKHKNEKNHCVNNPGCCDDADCCKDCKICKSKNLCGCDDPNCKHKNEKDHCKNNPGCCDDADCCKKCTTCKSKPNACGCDDPNCKHKNEKNHCKNNPGCCDDADCCKDCKTCKSKPNACGCDDPNCKHKNEKNHCKNNPGCCDDADCCKDCKTCKSKPVATTKPSADTTTKPTTTTKNPVQNVIETIKTGDNTFLLVALIGLVALSGGGYVFFGRTAKGKELLKKIREKLFKK